MLRSRIKTVTDALTTTTSTQKRVIFVGAKRSGKTTAFGCWSLACDLRSIQDPSFSHYVEEKTSGISQVPSDLCQGYFPEETPSGLIYEAQLHIRQAKPLRKKEVTIPICETAGEDMESLTGPYQESVYKQSPNWQSADILNRYICESNGYIIALPVSETNIPWVPHEFRDTKDEPQDLMGHFVDPDLTAKRILSAIFSYKDRNKKTSPPIDGIAILLTKTDKILHFIKGHGMNLNTAEGQHTFLTTYFRQTSGVLKYFGLEKVRFFPVFVEVEKIRTPENKVVIYKENGKPRIAVDKETNLPIFSKTPYQELIDWTLEIFG